MLSVAAAKPAAAPPVQYRVTKSAALRSTASAKSRKLGTVKKGTYLVSQSGKRGWVKARTGGKTGWFPTANASRLAQYPQQSTRGTTLRSSPGKGSLVTRVSKGRTMVSTGRTSGRYAQVYVAGKTGWVPKSDIRRGIMAKYQTSKSVSFYATSRSKKATARIPADFTLGTRTKAKSGSRIQVEYKGKTGWVGKTTVKTVALSVPLGKLSWKASAAKNIAKWCKGVPIKVGPNAGNMAEAFVTQSQGRKKVTEKITLDTLWFGSEKLDPNENKAVANQLHECSHILQYRAYKYDFVKLDKRMEAVYGGRTGIGTEHMADCMGEAMGATRSGREFDLRTGMIYEWTAGYGGKCTPKHLSQAKKLIAGKAL